MPDLSTMKTEVANTVGIDTSDTTQDTLLTGWLNDGVVDVLLRTQCYVTSATSSEVSGEGDYDLDAGILIAKTLRWSNSTSSIYAKRVPLEEIERLRAASTTTDTSSYPAVYFAVAGANKLAVWPTPSAADTITFYYVPRPTAMSSGAQDPSSATYGGVPAEYHRAVVFYALWRAADYADDQSSGQGERYHQLYEDEIRRIRKYRALHGGRPGNARFHPSRRRVPSRNDVYPGW